MRTLDDLMGLWPSVSEFGRDIGIKPSHAQTIRVRGSIPVEYWPAIIKAASERGFKGVTAERLMALHTNTKAAS